MDKTTPFDVIQINHYSLPIVTRQRNNCKAIDSKIMYLSGDISPLSLFMKPMIGIRYLQNLVFRVLVPEH